MGLRDRFGWTQQQARPVGQELETGGRSGSAVVSAQNRRLIRVGLYLGLVLLAVLAFPRGEVYEYAVQVGDTWRQPTLVAPFNFPIYKNAAKVETEREKARATTPPYFQAIPDARKRMAANRDTFRQQISGILEAFADYRYHASRGQADAANEDSLRYASLRRASLVTLSSDQWSTLTDAYVQQMPGSDAAATRRASPSAGTSRLDVRLREAAFQVGAQLLSAGVMNYPRDSVQTETITVRNVEERTQRSVPKDNVYGLNEAYRFAEQQLQERFDDPTHAAISFDFFQAIFQPSLRYMRAETNEERRRRARSVSPILGGLEEGEIVVSKGERITDDIKRRLVSLERVKNERSATRVLWQQMTGEVLFALTTFGFFFAYLFLIRTDIWRDDRHMVLITLVLASVLALFAIAVRISWVHLFVVPVALASVVLTIIYNSRIALLATLILAFLGGQMVGLDLEYTLATFLAGAVGIFSVRDIKNRGQFVVSAGLIALAYAIVLVAGWLYLGTPAERFLDELLFATAGASFTITATFVLWALERGFDLTTDLTLLELSDTNNELLKQLSLEAPGSFNHSLQVANLAEAAADRIDAHALLTRVGALYHDIGKMKKPEYFVENQRSGHNPHDNLKPRMSALIIASHVKEGTELAKQHNLPERVARFIPMHHGTSRIEFFYQKAVSETGEDDSPVLESEFRYPGPKPDSKETAILMLADSVEAASRSLEDPSHKRLKSLIDLLFKERIEDGQLEDTDLTFRDLTAIKETFLQMLLGIYHVRVKYPEQDEEKAAEPEPAELLVHPDGSSEDALNNISVLYKHDIWGAPERSVSAQRLRDEPGVRPVRALRPEVAEASPHHASPAASPPHDDPAAQITEDASASDDASSADERNSDG